MVNHEYKEIWDTAVDRACLPCKEYCVRATPTGNINPDQFMWQSLNDCSDNKQ